MTELRWGVVGTGRIARTVMSDLLLVPGADLVGVCSRDADRAAGFAAGLTVPEGRTTAPTAFTDLGSMISEIDVLYVATPHLQHPEPALYALEAGVAVLCEKPLTARYSDAEVMVETARSTGSFLMEALWTRFNPLHVRLRELIAEGTLGEIRRVVADFSFRNEYDPAGRLWDPARGGGTLLDMGVYPVNLIQQILGTPTGVDVHGSLSPNQVDDSATLLLRYPRGAAGVASCTLTAHGANTASIVGTEGRVDIEANALCPTRMTVTLGGTDLQPLAESGQVITAEIHGRGYVPMLEHVCDQVALGAGESPVLPLDDTLTTLRILTDALATLGVAYPASLV